MAATEVEFLGIPLWWISFPIEEVQIMTNIPVPFELKISKRVKRTTLQKYLISKLIVEPSKFSIEDLVVLFLNQVELEDRFSKGKSEENQIWLRELSSISEILKNFNFTQGLSDRAVNRLGERLENLQLIKLRVPTRNFENLQSKVKDSFSLEKIKSRDRRFEKPKSFIGKGYTDKGTLRNPALDGSPSWQEVSKSSKILPLPGERNYGRKKI